MTFVSFEVGGQSFGLAPDEVSAVEAELLRPRTVHDPELVQVALRLRKALDEEPHAFPATPERYERLLVALAEMAEERVTPGIATLRKVLRENVAADSGS